MISVFESWSNILTLEAFSDFANGHFTECCPIEPANSFRDATHDIAVEENRIQYNAFLADQGYNVKTQPRVFVTKPDTHFSTKSLGQKGLYNAQAEAIWAWDSAEFRRVSTIGHERMHASSSTKVSFQSPDTLVVNCGLYEAKYFFDGVKVNDSIHYHAIDEALTEHAHLSAQGLVPELFCIDADQINGTLGSYNVERLLLHHFVTQLSKRSGIASREILKMLFDWKFVGDPESRTKMESLIESSFDKEILLRAQSWRSKNDAGFPLAGTLPDGTSELLVRIGQLEVFSMVGS